MLSDTTQLCKPQSPPAPQALRAAPTAQGQLECSQVLQAGPPRILLFKVKPMLLASGDIVFLSTEPRTLWTT